jgi:hypothetical protein
VLFTIDPRFKNWQVLKNCQNDAPSVQYSTKLQNLVSARKKMPQVFEYSTKL